MDGQKTRGSCGYGTLVVTTPVRSLLKCHTYKSRPPEDWAEDADLVSCFQGGGEVHQPLDLDAVPGTHVADMVEIRRRRYHLRPSISIPTHGTR